MSIYISGHGMSCDENDRLCLERMHSRERAEARSLRTLLILSIIGIIMMGVLVLPYP